MNQRAAKRHSTVFEPPPLPPPATASSAAANGFSMDWIHRKLSRYEDMIADAIVELRDPRRLTPPETNELLRRLRKLNFVVYHCRTRSLTKNDLRALGLQLGLSRLDHNLCADAQSISSVCVRDDLQQPRYIPYTDRPLGWHTDGYYNAANRAVRSFILHCVAPAENGGDNWLLDPEIVYLLLNQKNPNDVAALSDPEAFSIPAGVEAEAEPAPGRTGPVFSVDPATGALHMRYTARQRSIKWNLRLEIQNAAARLRETIEQASRYTLRHRLARGQGIICNNVLHKRAGFVQSADASNHRLLFRARYYDRVLGT